MRTVNYMKNKFYFVIVSILVIFTLVACGNGGGQSSSENGSASGEREKITFWFWGAEPYARDVFDKALIQKYNESQDKYELAVEYRNSVDQDLNTALAANSGPDIVYGSGPAFIKPLVEAGKLETLDAYSKEYKWEERMLTPIYEAGKVEDSLYAVGNGLTTVGIFYNKKVLDDHGWKVPKTEEELLKIMDAAKDKGLYPSVTGNKGWQPVNENYASLFLTHYANPENVYKALKGEIKWTDPAFVNAINKSAEWYQKGYLGGGDYPNLNFSESLQLLADEKTPFFIGPSIAYQWAKSFFTGDQEENFKFMPFPPTKEVPNPTYTIGLASTYSINANATQEHKDEAAKIIDMMIQEDFVENISAEWPGYWAAPLKDFDKISSEGMSPMAVDFIENEKKIVQAINDGNFGYMTNVFFPPATQHEFISIENVWMEQSTTEEFLSKVEATFEPELQKDLVPEVPAPLNAAK